MSDTFTVYGADGNAVLSATPKSLLREYHNFFTRMAHPSLNENYEVVGDNGQPIAGMSAVLDGQGHPIPGVLCLDSGKPGPNAGMIAMTHMNEPAGLAAHKDIYDRWIEQGGAPDGMTGKLYLILGGDIQGMEAFFSTVTDTNISGMDIVEFTKFREVPTTRRGEKVLDDSGKPISFNFNRIPKDFHDRAPDDLSDQEQRIALLKEHVLDHCAGNALDIHTTSNASVPIAIPYGITDTMGLRATDMASREKLTEIMQEVKGDISKLIQGMPKPDVLTDIINILSGLPIVGIGHQEPGNTPIAVEAAGPHLMPDTFETAREFGKAWLNNLFGIALPLETASYDPDTLQYYTNAESMKHPRWQGDEAIQALYAQYGEDRTHAILNDTFISIQDPSLLFATIESLPWSQRAKSAITEEWPEVTAVKSGRMKHAARVEEGEPLAIGVETGHIIRAPKSGFLVITAADYMIPPTKRSEFTYITDNIARQELLENAASQQANNLADSAISPVLHTPLH